MLEGVATLLSALDSQQTSIGMVRYKVRLRKPIGEALRIYREKQQVIGDQGMTRSWVSGAE